MHFFGVGLCCDSRRTVGYPLNQDMEVSRVGPTALMLRNCRRLNMCHRGKSFKTVISENLHTCQCTRLQQNISSLSC